MRALPFVHRPAEKHPAQSNGVARERRARVRHRRQTKIVLETPPEDSVVPPLDAAAIPHYESAAEKTASIPERNYLPLKIARLRAG
jgi:hypothetical protein